MKKKRNKGVEIVVLLGCLALFTFLVYIKERADNPSLPKSAAINEPLKTYHVGNMALEMPESWELSHMAASFDLSDEKSSPRISFKESIKSENKDASEKFKEHFNSKKKIDHLFYRKRLKGAIIVLPRSGPQI